MSRKQPEIKVIYPDASAAAMLLTDAMIRRSTGKRVVETNSEEKEYTGEQLFGGVLSTKTDTSVELTLRLNPDAMDYALTMLVAKNLTEEEKRAIRMETDSMEIVDLLSPRAQAAQAPGQALDGRCSPDVPSAEREAGTQSGEQDAIDVPLLEAPADKAETCLWMAAALGVLLSLTSNSPAGKKSTWRQMAYIYLSEPEPTFPAGAIVSREEIDLAFEIAEKISNEMNPTSPYIVNPEELLARVFEKIKPETQDKTKIDNPSWDDVEAEARQMQAPAPKQSAAPLADTAGGDNEVGTKSEPTDGEIEPGLLNDIEDGTDDQDYIDGYIIRKGAEEERHG